MFHLKLLVMFILSQVLIYISILCFLNFLPKSCKLLCFQITVFVRHFMCRITKHSPSVLLHCWNLNLAIDFIWVVIFIPQNRTFLLLL